MRLPLLGGLGLGSTMGGRSRGHPTTMDPRTTSAASFRMNVPTRIRRSGVLVRAGICVKSCASGACPEFLEPVRRARGYLMDVTAHPHDKAIASQARLAKSVVGLFAL